VTARVRHTGTLLATALAALVAFGPPTVAANPEPTPIVVGIVLREVGPAFAVIQDPATSKAGFYHIGASIHGAIVTEILADRVILASGDQRTQLRLATPVGGTASTAPGSGPMSPVPTGPRPAARTSGPTAESSPSPYAGIATVTGAAGGSVVDSGGAGGGSQTPMGIAPQAGGPEAGSTGSQAGVNATLTLVGQLHDGGSLQAAQFSTTSLRDLLILMRYTGASSSQRQRLEIYAPDGSLYQRLAGAVAPSTQRLLPVGGTWITEHGLFGNWRVDVYLDRETSPIVSGAFTLTP
jgi:hypothetical protein